MKDNRFRSVAAVLLLGLAGVGLLLSLLLAPAAAQPAPVVPTAQWALERLAATCAWDYTRGSPHVTVAVLDTGVDADHPDLQGVLRDDGYDFVDDDDDPRDENGHGTHVTGIIAGTLSQRDGVQGLAPGVRVLPIRVMNAEGWGRNEDIAAGIRYATRKGAQVINLSLGATLYTLDGEQRESVVGGAIRAAQEQGVLVVVAAGNDFVPFPNVLAYENPGVLLVAASDAADRRAAFSNIGPWVDVVAPGQQIRSTMPTYEVFLTSTAVSPAERFTRHYAEMSGTSQAAPYASALAALLFSRYPAATADDVQQVLRETSDLSIYAQHPASFRRLHELGDGRLDACAALQHSTAPTR